MFFKTAPITGSKSDSGSAAQNQRVLPEMRDNREGVSATHVAYQPMAAGGRLG